MNSVFIISNATQLDGKLQANEILIENTYRKAIEIAQNSIAYDFGFYDWNEYIEKRDPKITEENGIYTICDKHEGHSEMYRIDNYIYE